MATGALKAKATPVAGWVGSDKSIVPFVRPGGGACCCLERNRRVSANRIRRLFSAYLAAMEYPNFFISRSKVNWVCEGSVSHS